jgi:dienelactone hydrolase
MTKHEARKRLYDLLGDLPERLRLVSGSVISKEKHNGYMLEKLTLDLNGVEPVPAYFVRPFGARKPTPCILYNHAHGGNYVLGKDELLNGQDAMQMPPYAKALTSLGYSALCIDHWAFGERRGRKESEIFKDMLWHGRVMWGMMVYDSLKAVDYITSRPDCDPDRIGTLGLSMGSTMAWWTAALDERIRVCVDICCLTDYQAMIESRGVDWHSIYYFVPSLLNHFTTSSINALISPRPHLGLAGNYDTLTPAAGLDRIDAELKEVYRSEGVPERWRLIRSNTGHFETAYMRAEILAFLKHWMTTDVG